MSQRESAVLLLPERDGMQALLLFFRETKHLFFANDFILLFKASLCWTQIYQVKQKPNCAALLLNVWPKEPFLKAWGM